MPHDHHDHEHDHSHDGLSPSGHPYRADNDTDLSYWQAMEIALRELLIEKGHLTAAQIHSQINAMDSRSPANGARVVARAWSEPDFKAWLLKDATAAIADMGYHGRQGEHMYVVENTAEVHNLVVCTLCSCYPWPVLGLPPTWYKSAPYRARAVIDPRGVLAEFGTEVGVDVSVRVWDSTAELRYLVLPEQPKGTEGMNQEELAALVGRNAMIGVEKVSAL